ncbi:MAG: hypothetical protein AABY22_12905 [Nanoarchaeota archaeon]|mgnify:CR=1 FL=1
MKIQRKNCVVCGRGFHCPNNDFTKFDKKQCAMKYYGKDWKPGMYTKPSKKRMTTEEKIAYVKSL